MSARPYEQANPAVAFDGANYFVVWQDDRRGLNWEDICGARVTPGGVVLDPAGIPVDTSAQWQWRPAVAFGGGNYRWSGRTTATLIPRTSGAPG